MSNKEDKSHYLSLKKIAYLSFVISVFFHLLFVVSIFFGKTFFLSTGGNVVETDVPRPKFELMHFSIHLMRTYILVFLLFLFDRSILNKSFKGTLNSVLLVIGSLVITISFIFIAMMIDFIVSQGAIPEFVKFDRILRDELIRNTMLSFIVVLVSLLIKSVTDSKDIAIENETLKTENMRGRFEALKNQMDPHFVFNSLNTLKSLISMDTEKAEDYLQKMSCVMRYSLQGKEVVDLDEDLQYLKDYCMMMNMRYGDNLIFDTKIDDEARGRLILPLTLQGLVENAIKHNVISSKKPLTISIATQGNQAITVSNNLQPKLDKEKSSGIGLANLSERYRLMWDRDIVINDDNDDRFEVTIPLIENTLTNQNN